MKKDFVELMDKLGINAVSNTIKGDWILVRIIDDFTTTLARFCSDEDSEQEFIDRETVKLMNVFADNISGTLNRKLLDDEDANLRMLYSSVVCSICSIIMTDSTFLNRVPVNTATETIIEKANKYYHVSFDEFVENVNKITKEGFSEEF